MHLTVNEKVEEQQQQIKQEKEEQFSIIKQSFKR